LEQVSVLSGMGEVISAVRTVSMDLRLSCGWHFSAYPEAHRQSRAMLNLPVDQDVEVDVIPGLVAALAEIVSR
jgi:hypothetical protein